MEKQEHKMSIIMVYMGRNVKIAVNKCVYYMLEKNLKKKKKTIFNSFSAEKNPTPVKE